MKRPIDYGLDAPGVVRGMALGGGAALVAGIGGWFVFHGAQPGVAGSLLANGLIFAAYFFAVVLLMLWSSRVGKFAVCDRLVKALELSGPERVLDVGCGRGLALIAVAKVLTTGKAVGIDLWSAKDLSGNNVSNALTNAALEGVADRVEVETADMRALPFANASFDAVISMTAIHNVPDRAGRDKALTEIARVLKPGGRAAIFDILHPFGYAKVLRRHGLAVERSGLLFYWSVPGRIWIAKKPA